MELKQRVKSTDTKITQDIYDWQNKLQILQEEAGDIGDAPTIDHVITTLHGVVTFALLDGVMWSDEHANNIKEVSDHSSRSNWRSNIVYSFSRNSMSTIKIR